ncbi:MAG TPA: sulfatase-like hydrolase/transferase [Verrucomicrobiae bacterium]|nr:sulfatase-like hydrolase/transferase [Verrucomicrobiae bacterium]
MGWLGVLLVGWGVVGLGWAWGAGDGAKGAPNLLFILTDQQYAGAMSCAGNLDVSTPAIDSLAARGVRFESAYCSQPLCLPSRVAMVTGAYPHEFEATHNAPKWERALVPLLGSVLSAGGYQCAWFGKWHLPLEPSKTAEHGFAIVEHDRGRGNDERIAGAVSRFLARPDGRPFFVVASFTNPHNICEWARGEPTPEGPIPPPPPPEACPALPQNYEIPFDEPEVIRAIQARHPPGYPTTGWAPDRWRQYRWAYCRLVEKVDAEVRRLLDVIEERGVAGTTIVIFSSDHGDGNGAHRWNQKQVLYEEATRVPFVITTPGMRAGRVDRDHLIDAGLDLYPTLCDFARVKPPPHLRGRSVRPLLEDAASASWREHVVCETEFAANSGGMGISGRLVRTGRYKYICYSEGGRREQFFDIQKDPGESLNLIGVPELAAGIREHRERLARWCRETGDAFPVPGTAGSP